MHNHVCVKLYFVLLQEDALIIDDVLACEKLLRRKFVNQKRELNLLIAALRERIPQNLAVNKEIKTEDAMLHKLAKRLVTQRGITKEDSYWVVSPI